MSTSLPMTPKAVNKRLNLAVQVIEAFTVNGTCKLEPMMRILKKEDPRLFNKTKKSAENDQRSEFGALRYCVMFCSLFCESDPEGRRALQLLHLCNEPEAALPTQTKNIMAGGGGKMRAMWLRKMGITPEKVPVDIKELGNALAVKA